MVGQQCEGRSVKREHGPLPGLVSGFKTPNMVSTQLLGANRASLLLHANALYECRKWAHYYLPNGALCKAWAGRLSSGRKVQQIKIMCQAQRLAIRRLISWAGYAGTNQQLCTSMATYPYLGYSSSMHPQ